MKTGQLYFLRRGDGLIKVGYTGKFKDRLAVLTRSHGPLEIIRVINGDRRREVQLHAAFAKWNEFGEWFRDSADLRCAIAELSEGTAVSLTETEAKRQWKEGDERYTQIAKEKVERLLLIRRQRSGSTDKDCIEALAAEYGIQANFMIRLLAGRTIAVGAYPFALIEKSLLSEMTAFRDQLLTEVALVEAGQPLPEPTSRRRFQKRS